MPHPDRITAFLDQVVPALEPRLSVKLRLGLDRPDEALAVLRVLDSYPIDEVIIHARVATQLYAGAVDLDGFAACLDATRHPVVYNGDIRTVRGFDELRQRFPEVSRWMIGRGALADPSLPCRIKGREVDLTRQLPRLHAELYADARARLDHRHSVLGRMQGLWTFFLDAAQVGDELRARLRRVGSLEEYEAVVGKIFEALITTESPPLREAVE